MSIAVHPTKSRTEDQTSELDGGSHNSQKRTRQELKTALKKHSVERELGAYFGGEFKRKKRAHADIKIVGEFWVLVPELFPLGKTNVLNYSNYLLVTFPFHSFSLFFFFFFLKKIYRSVVENWWSPIPGKVMQGCIPVLAPIWWEKETVIQQSWLFLVNLSFNYNLLFVSFFPF